jgi:Cu(I)/Ag(I) efflux system membrane fusion protein
MNGKMKKFIATIMLVSFASAMLLFLNGCKKSEPQTSMTSVESKKKSAESAKEAVTAAAVEQTMCPVMDGNKIDKNVFFEYKGKKVYFCCPACIEKFKAEPEKYVAKLPQFKP